MEGGPYFLLVTRDDAKGRHLGTGIRGTEEWSTPIPGAKLWAWEGGPMGFCGPVEHTGLVWFLPLPFSAMDPRLQEVGRCIYGGHSHGLCRSSRIDTTCVLLRV